jgi:pimeloyl-ACP methyl ester carboxylesterase
MSSETESPVLVLLPGLEGTGSLFAPVIRALGPAVDTLVFHYPVNETLGYAELESLVRARLPVDRPFVLLGESFSGPLAMRIGAHPPQGLVGVILCVTFANIPGPFLRWVVKLGPLLPMKSSPRWMLGHALWGAYAVGDIPQQTIAAIQSVDAAVLRGRLAAMAEVDESSALAQIAVPILVLQASRDRLVPARSTEHILKIQPKAARALVEGPHLLLQTKPDECADLLRNFLSAL